MKKKKLEIELNDAPPSVNAFWGQHGPIKYITKKGKEWRKHIQENLPKESLGGARLKLDITITFKGKRKRDLDNYLKPLIDTFSGFLFDDDEQIDEIVAKRIYGKDNHVDIILEAL
jgi:Holliday junction resolvase RusA-like endonuclease